MTVLNVAGAERVTRDESGQPSVQPTRLLAIPYATWNNRGLSPMGVWLPREAAGVSQPTTTSKPLALQ